MSKKKNTIEILSLALTAIGVAVASFGVFTWIREADDRALFNEAARATARSTLLQRLDNYRSSGSNADPIISQLIHLKTPLDEIDFKNLTITNLDLSNAIWNEDSFIDISNTTIGEIRLENPITQTLTLRQSEYTSIDHLRVLGANLRIMINGSINITDLYAENSQIRFDNFEFTNMRQMINYMSLDENQDLSIRMNDYGVDIFTERNESLELYKSVFFNCEVIFDLNSAMIVSSYYKNSTILIDTFEYQNSQMMAPINTNPESPFTHSVDFMLSDFRTSTIIDINNATFQPTVCTTQIRSYGNQCDYRTAQILDHYYSCMDDCLPDHIAYLSPRYTDIISRIRTGIPFEEYNNLYALPRYGHPAD